MLALVLFSCDGGSGKKGSGGKSLFTPVSSGVPYEEMLKMGPYPAHLKERIAGTNGHMSNRDTAQFLADNIHEGLKNIWLCHLSKDNNHPELAYKTVEFIFRSKGILVGKDVQLAALKRNTPSEFHEFE